MTDRILILDFGSQVTQLIARRVRESGVYCEIHPFTIAEDKVREFAPAAVILSGGPASVTRAASPRAPEIVFGLGVPVLGICYGMQTMCAQLGGRVTLSDHQEFGRAFIDILGDCRSSTGCGRRAGGEQVWMSHGDRVDALPPGFRAVAASEAAPYAAIADDERRFYGVLFHPEVVHTPQGGELLRNFTHRVARCRGDWTMARFRAEAIDRIRAPGGDGRRRLRPLGRRRFRGRGGAAARGDRRPADLHLCRHRPVARRRGRGGGRPLPRPLQHPADPSRRRRPVPRQARRRHRPRGQAQGDRRHLHRRLRRGGARGSAASSSWRRARSTPT